jgi:hypothetical protein
MKDSKVKWEMRLVAETLHNHALTPARRLFLGKVGIDEDTGEMVGRPI